MSYLNSSSTFVIQVKFSQALSIIRTIPPDITELQPVVADKLQFYGLYKQATQGDINIHKPSSRQVVDYAKWKAWYRMKGMSPLEAQKLYINSLIQLLTELIHRYPRHEYTEYLTNALVHLQSMNRESEDVYEDAYDQSEFENNPHFLNSIEAEQLSPPLSYTYPPTPITMGYDSDDREVAMTLAPKESLERLQTEITALTEQMDRLRCQKNSWTLRKCLWGLIKHALADSLLLLLVFLIMWKRKSPLAYAIMDRLVPLSRTMGYRILRSVVFWKVTV